MLHFLPPGASSASLATAGTAHSLVWVAVKGEGEPGTSGMEGCSCHGEVVLLEEAVAWGSAGKGRTGQLSRGWASLLEEGGIGEGGAARGDQGFVYSACICLEILTVYVHFY